MPKINKVTLFVSYLTAIVPQNYSTTSRKDAFLCLVLVIHVKTSNTWVVRVQQVEESSPIFPPVGRALLHRHGASFLGL